MPGIDLESLYGQYSRMVYWAARGILKSESDAWDVTQNTFLRAMKHMGTISDMEENRQKGWLYRVAVNLCMDIKRKQKRELPVEELPEEESGRIYELPEQNAIRAEQKRMVMEAIEALPDAYRETVTMHYFSGLNYKEIAELTGTTEGTVKSRIARSKQRLYELLKEGEKND